MPGEVGSGADSMMAKVRISDNDKNNIQNIYIFKEHLFVTFKQNSPVGQDLFVFQLIQYLYSSNGIHLYSS